MSGQSAGAGQSPDLDGSRLEGAVASQLRRRRKTRHSEHLLLSEEEIERHVRETLYGKTYYHGTQRRVYKELEGHHAT